MILKRKLKMYQAGVKNIKLYENKGIDFHYYDPLDLRAITDLTSTGQIITIPNEQQPEFEIKLKLTESGEIGNEYLVEFFLFEISIETYNTINQLKSSIYGWCFLVEFYDGTQKFYNTPTYCKESEIKPHDEMSFSVSLKSAVPSLIQYLEYTPDVSTVPIYRADTTLLTADTTIYTADYAL